MQHDGPDRALAAVWVLFAALAALAAAFAGATSRHGGHFSPWWPLGTALCVAGGQVVVPLQRGRVWAATFRAVSWAAAGGWVAWGYAFGWPHWYWQAWAFGSLGLAALALTAGVPPSPLVSDPVTPLGEWAETIATVTGLRGAHSVQVAQWPAGTGYRVAGVCGPGWTWASLAKHEAALAGALRLPAGCGCKVGPGEHRGAFTVDVSTVDAMAEAREYPE